MLPPRLLPRQPLQLGTQREFNTLWTSEVGIQTQSEFSTSVFGEVKPSFGFCCAFLISLGTPRDNGLHCFHLIHKSLKESENELQVTSPISLCGQILRTHIYILK